MRDRRQFKVWVMFWGTWVYDGIIVGAKATESYRKHLADKYKDCWKSGATRIE